MVLGSHYRLEFKKIFKMQTKLIEKLRKVVNEDMEKSLLEVFEVYKNGYSSRMPQVVGR